jgi:hypothetical protein
MRLTAPTSLGLTVLALLMAGCGSSDNGVAAKPASEILQATIVAAKSASSVHVTVSSKITRGGSLELDATLAKDRGHAQVSLYGTTFEVIRDGDTLYVKGNQLFAARLGAVLGVKIPANTWLKGSTTGPLAQTGSFTSIEKELPLMLQGSGPISKGATIKINGQPAITLKETRKLYAGTLYVATTGKPYPLKLLKTGPGQSSLGETGHTTFTNWNDPTTVTPPSNAIDISQLEHAKKAH